MTSSVGFVAMPAVASATSGFPIVGLIVALIVVVVVVGVLVAVFSRLSWRSRGEGPWRGISRVQRAAAADVAEPRENDGYYDPDGPGLREDDL